MADCQSCTISRQYFSVIRMNDIFSSIKLIAHDQFTLVDKEFWHPNCPALKGSMAQ